MFTVKTDRPFMAFDLDREDAVRPDNGAINVLMLIHHEPAKDGITVGQPAELATHDRFAKYPPAQSRVLSLDDPDRLDREYERQKHAGRAPKSERGK